MVKGDIGTSIECNMRIDLTGATLLQIKYRKPSGITGTWTATAVGTDRLQFTTILNSIDEAGSWTFQPYAEKPAWKGHGRAQTVVVEDHL